jgi:hypothetical protein
MVVLTVTPQSINTHDVLAAANGDEQPNQIRFPVYGYITRGVRLYKATQFQTGRRDIDDVDTHTYSIKLTTLSRPRTAMNYSNKLSA